MILIPVTENKGNLLIKMFLYAGEQKQATSGKLIKIVLSDIQTPLDTKIDTSISKKILWPRTPQPVLLSAEFYINFEVSSNLLSDKLE